MHWLHGLEDELDIPMRGPPYERAAGHDRYGFPRIPRTMISATEAQITAEGRRLAAETARAHRRLEIDEARRLTALPRLTVEELWAQEEREHQAAKNNPQESP